MADGVGMECAWKPSCSGGTIGPSLGISIPSRLLPIARFDRVKGASHDGNVLMPLIIHAV